MKLKVQTITGQTHDVQVEQNSTINDVKKEIYRSGKITGAVRILKGQEILPDDSTLVQHNISDGDTVNIITGPEKEIQLNLQFGPECLSGKVQNSMLVKDLKQLLIDSKQFTFTHRDFDLHLDMSDRKLKLDTMFPLHFYGIDHNAITIEKAYLLVIIERVGDRTEWIERMPKEATVNEVKKVILRDICQKSELDISIYSPKHKKLEGEDVLTEFMNNFDEVFTFVENKTYQRYEYLYYKGNKIGLFGVEENDTEEYLKAKAQNQLCISKFRIKLKKPDPENWNKCKSYVIQRE